MNAKNRNSLILAVTATILFLASCDNPTNARLSVVPPSTGIDSNSVTGLVAGFPLEGDAILENTSVDTSEGLDGIEWVEGISGNAMRTDSDGEFIRITDDTLTDNLVSGSVEAWIFPEGEAADHYYTGIVHKGERPDYTDEAWTLQFCENLTPLFYFVSETGATVWLESPTIVSLDNWHYLAATWSYDADTEDTTVTLYVDDKESVTIISNKIGPVMASEGDLLIGSQLPEPYNVSNGHFTFNGIIDEVALYDEERSAEDILATYQALVPTP